MVTNHERAGSAWVCGTAHADPTRQPPEHAWRGEWADRSESVCQLTKCVAARCSVMASRAVAASSHAVPPSGPPTGSIAMHSHDQGSPQHTIAGVPPPRHGARAGVVCVGPHDPHPSLHHTGPGEWLRAVCGARALCALCARARRTGAGLSCQLQAGAKICWHAMSACMRGYAVGIQPPS